MKKWQAILLALALLLIAGCGGPPKADKVANEMKTNLDKIETVQGRLRLNRGTVSLEQELWVEMPKSLRAEIESGPPGFEGSILVLNDEEAWFYNPTLDMATVADRSQYSPDMGLGVGSSVLETLPNDMLAALQSSDALRVVGEEQVAERETYHVEAVIGEGNEVFAAGPLNVWLDSKFYYPLAIEASDGLEIRFEFVKFNEDVSPLTFTFVPPPGTTVRRVSDQ